MLVAITAWQNFTDLISVKLMHKENGILFKVIEKLDQL